MRIREILERELVVIKGYLSESKKRVLITQGNEKDSLLLRKRASRNGETIMIKRD